MVEAENEKTYQARILIWLRIFYTTYNVTIDHELDMKLFDAASANDLEQGQRLIALGADPNWSHPGEYDFTPLHQAIRERHEAFAAMLIAQPNINLTATDCLDRTPAEMAHMVGHHEIGYKIAEALEARAHAGPTEGNEPSPSRT